MMKYFRFSWWSKNAYLFWSIGSWMSFSSNIYFFFITVNMIAICRHYLNELSFCSIIFLIFGLYQFHHSISQFCMANWYLSLFLGFCSMEKSIDRYRRHARSGVNNNEVTQVQIFWSFYFFLYSGFGCFLYWIFCKNWSGIGSLEKNMHLKL